MTKNKKLNNISFDEIYWEIYRMVKCQDISCVNVYYRLVHNIENNLYEIHSYFGLYDDAGFDV